MNFPRLGATNLMIQIVKPRVKLCHTKINSFLFSLLLLTSLGLLDCKKNKSSPGPVVNGTIFGFDPCTGDYTDNSKKGWVIKIETSSDSGTLVDTAVTYNLPQIFDFPPELFADYINDYRFPAGYQDTFKFKFSYITTPDNKKNYPLCTANIFLGAFIAATKGHEITITANYGIIR